MQFRIKRTTFLEGVQKTLGIAEKNSTNPILNNILIKAVNSKNCASNHASNCASNGKITIMATNIEIGITLNLNAEIASEGEITLSARKLFEMIREIEGEIIDFKKMENNQAVIMCGKVRYNVPGIPADDFPFFSDDTDIDFTGIEGCKITELIDKTSFAMAREDYRPSLNGAFFQNDNTGMSMVATDGHRLSLTTLSPACLPANEVINSGIILPRKGIQEIRKLIGSESGKIEIGFRKGACILRKDTTTLRVSLVDGEYPDYRKVIPTDKGMDVLLDKETILRSLKRMSVVCNEKNRRVVRIRIGHGYMALNSINPDIGEAAEEIDISYNGDEVVEAAYNVGYLIDAIEVIKGSVISFEMREGLRPCVIKEAGLSACNAQAGNDSYMCVIMPIKM